MRLRPSHCALFSAVTALALELAGAAWIAFPPDIPSAETSVAALCDRFIVLCRAKGFAGHALRLDRISGPAADPYFDSLAPALNERLAPGFRSLQSTAALRRAAMERVEELLREREWVQHPPELTRARPDVYLSAEWRPREARIAVLTLRAVRLNGTADVIEAAASLLPPAAAAAEAHRRRWVVAAVAGGLAPTLTLWIWSLRAIARPRTLSTQSEEPWRNP